MPLPAPRPLKVYSNAPDRLYRPVVGDPAGARCVAVRRDTSRDARNLGGLRVARMARLSEVIDARQARRETLKRAVIWFAWVAFFVAAAWASQPDTKAPHWEGPRLIARKDTAK